MLTEISSDTAVDRLALYRSRDVLRRRYKELHDRTLPVDKAKEITAHLDQAEQYFRSASLAGVLAGPLEQYYGVLAYARAAILYLDPRIREAGLRHGHGLKGTIS